MNSQTLYKEPKPTEELLCINAEKVYDWVILQASDSQNVLAGAIDPLAVNICAGTVTDLTARCFLVDPVTGDPLEPNAEIDIEEIGERETRRFIVDGKKVTLQRISFIKTLSVVVEFSGVDVTTPFVVQTQPITFEFPETVFLCAPEGTRLIVRVTDVECSANANCVGEVLQSIDILLSLCQSVQSVADVTLEITADFCEPRDILIEQCVAPSIPKQCPSIFPAHHSKHVQYDD
ncbi:hypothetical protein HXZ66_13560 [Bacillus sp. A116_S68]|nr:hypothetical protein HXZ66_13560 [Bacillus sp. A116_S68]